jgi:glycosyltransferase involved in cell wall biosynthesis
MISLLPVLTHRPGTPELGMKLMIVEPEPQFGGGSEAVLLDLAKGLTLRGHQLFLVHEQDGSMLPAFDAFVIERLRARLPGFPRRRPGGAAGCIAAIGRSCRRWNIDAIIASNLRFIPVAAWVRAFYGTPWCFHLGLPSPARRRLSYRALAAGVAPSAHTAETWRRDGWPAGRLQVIPNWVDPIRFRPQADRHGLRRELGLHGDAFHVVFVGRICREKGVEVLLEAFRRTAAGVPDAFLVLVGRVQSGFEGRFDSLLASFDPELRRRIVVRSETDTPEKYFAAADLGCIPPVKQEAFGLTLLEAMSSALPVVATDVGIFAEILGTDHADLLIAPHDVAGLASKLRCWLENRAAGEERGRQLRRRVVDHFAPDRSIARYESLLLDIANGRRPVLHAQA